MSSSTPGYRVTIGKLQIIMILGFLLFSYGSFASIQQGVIWVSVLFALFALLAAYALLFYGSISLDDKGIRHSTLMGTYQMRWDEIREIKYSQGILVFIGSDKRVSVVDTEYWSAPDLEVVRDFYYNQVEKIGVPYEKDPRAMFLASKNSKVD